MIRLWGYKYSVYTWIVRMALAERGLTHDWTEVNPFDPASDNPHPFGRVPMLGHGDLRLFEVSAITTYLDRAFPGDSWTPDAPLAQARVAQVIGIVDSYGYWPLVREVFAPVLSAQAEGRALDEALVAKGMATSQPVLAALEGIAAEGHVLTGELTRADLHLAPMISYFAIHPPAAQMLAEFPSLNAWFEAIRRRPSCVSTFPELPLRSE